MRTLIVLSVFSLVALPGAFSQQESSGTKVGIGVAIEPFRLIPVTNTFITLAVTPIAISIPIEVAGGTRIAPELGIVRFSNESGTSTTTSSFLRLGAGVSFPVHKVENGSVYLGPSVGVFLQSFKTSSGSFTSESSETDVFVSLNVGGEYAASEIFRFFGEAQLYYLSYGKPSSASTRSQSAIFTNAQMGMRLYF